MKSKITLLGFMGIMMFNSSFTATAQSTCNCKTVTGNVEVWDVNNDPGNQPCIQVETGKTLTIDGLNLEFYCPTGKITVERGGKLILKNTTITSRYRALQDESEGFEGILVKGNSSVHHMNYYRTAYDPSDPNFSSFGGYNSTEHGILIMQNCTLKQVLSHESNKKFAAITSKDGGILELYDNYFENNQTDIYITNFNKQQDLVEAPNAFNIINCTFKRVKDANTIPNSYFEPHIKLEACNRVQIEGCHFAHEYPGVDINSYRNRKTGILVDRASFNLQKSGFDRKVTSLDNTTTDRLDQITKCPQYTLPFARRNKFTDLTYGIETDVTYGISNQRHVGISNSVFLNCYLGIHLQVNSTNQDKTRVAIGKNTWTLNGNHKFQTVGNGISGTPYPNFITLNRISKFEISENAGQCSIDQIDNKDFGVSFIQLVELKNPEGEIYRNNVAIVDHTENPANTITGFSCVAPRTVNHSTTGVSAFINKGQNNRDQVHITCTYFGNIKSPIVTTPTTRLIKQGNMDSNGDRTEAAQNEFDNCGSPRIDVKNADQGYTLDYLYNGTDDDPDPNNDLAKIDETATQSPYSCPPIGCKEWPVKYIDPATQIQYQNTDFAAISFWVINRELRLRNNGQHPANMYVVSINGKEVYNASVPNGMSTHSLTSLPAGMYVFKVGNNQEGWVTEKIMMQ